MRAASVQRGRDSSPERHGAAGPGPADRPRVLIVEDEPRMRRFVAEALEDPFVVSVAVGGWAGVDRLFEPALDLVVAGTSTARRGNDHIVSRVRACRHFTNVPILIRCAEAEHVLRMRLLHEGALDYVVEPFSVQELRARALNLVNIKRLRDVLAPYATSPSQDLHALAQQLALAKERAEEAQRRAEAESRAKDDLLAAVAHELRTPLSAIVGWARLQQLDPERGDAIAALSDVVPRPLLVGSRVLLVEPDSFSRQTIVSGLQQHGAIVLAAATMSEVGHLVESFGPDLLLGDVDLLEEDGYAVVERLRSQGRRISAIALTTHRLDEHSSPSSAVYRPHVGKPVDLGELVTAISAVSGLRQRGDA
jgi:DNA-binding response OmpR family regulator